MNPEFLQKLALSTIPLFLTACTIYLSFRQFSLGAKTAYREEYKFAKSFFDDLKASPHMHKYALHKGYQAVSGNRSLPTVVLEFLMQTQDPVKAVNNYASSKSYIEHVFANGNFVLQFRKDFRFSTVRRRKFWLFFYASISILFYLLLFSPLFAFNFKFISSGIAIALASFTVPCGIIGTFTFVLEFIKLHNAISLLKQISEDRPFIGIEVADEEHY